MASIAYSVLWLLSDHALSSWVQLMIAVALCGAIYSAMVFLFQQTTKETFLQLIRRG
jgi:hypothetical protein